MLPQRLVFQPLLFALVAFFTFFLNLLQPPFTFLANFFPQFFNLPQPLRCVFFIFLKRFHPAFLCALPFALSFLSLLFKRAHALLPLPFIFLKILFIFLRMLFLMLPQRLVFQPLLFALVAFFTFFLNLLQPPFTFLANFFPQFFNLPQPLRCVFFIFLKRFHPANFLAFFLGAFFLGAFFLGAFFFFLGACFFAPTFAILMEEI